MVDLGDREELYENLASFLKRLVSFSACEGLTQLAEADLTFTQVRMLLLASSGEPLPISRIADSICMSTTATGRGVERLVQLGFLQRRESDEDRRVKLVTITNLGQEVLDQHHESRDQLLRAFVDQIPAKHVSALVDALRPIVADADSLTIKEQTPSLADRYAK